MKRIFLNAIIVFFFVITIVSCAPAANGTGPDTSGLKPKYNVQDVAEYEINSSNNASGLKKEIFYYYSSDLEGNRIKLSGLIVSPDNIGTKKLRQIVLVEHGTIQKNSTAPSVSKSPDMNLIPTYNDEEFTVLVCPDYIGFGITSGKVHPYLNSEITAVNSLDMLLAAIKYFKNQNISFSNSFNSMVTGYSQGGASALAVHKYIDTFLASGKCDEIKFSKSVCGGSPSDIKSTMEAYIAPGFSATDLHLVLVFTTIQGMLVSHPDILGNYSINDFFKTNFNNGKNASDVLVELNKKDESVLTNVCSLFPSDKSSSNIYNDQLLDSNSEIYKALVQAFAVNNVTSWNLKHPLYAYHGTDDTVVPYANHETLKNGMSGYTTLFTEGHSPTNNPSNSHGLYCEKEFIYELNDLRDIKNTALVKN